jgi:GT2 family glycosyltransferase
MTVAAIIVNYRTPALTIQCVESLLASLGAEPSIIVVDNASGDDSVDQFRVKFGQHPRITILDRTVNDGYAGGNNAGIAVARAQNAQHAFVLNSDTVVDPQCVRLLLEEMRDPEVALVTPRIFFGDERDRLWFGGGRFSLWHGRPIHVGFRRDATHGWQTRRDLSFASGCALLVRLDALDGDCFDTSLFSYAEDLDLSLRVRSLGAKIRYVPEALVWHYDGSSHRRAGGQSLRFYLGTRNLLRVLARHARWYHWVTLGPLVAIDVVGRYCVASLRNGDFDSVGAVMRGVRDSLRMQSKSVIADHADSADQRGFAPHQNPDSSHQH